MSLLSATYGFVVSVRNRLYDQGALRARKLSGPVISVGSISAGGAGKTPFVILLGELLKQRGIPFDVLSRGYGRRTRGVLLVDKNGSAATYGDEPLLIAKRLGCPVIVGESRYEAGVRSERTFGPQLHILDDGFQHRSLARDFDIVLLTPEDVKDDLLPTGCLREPLACLCRADAVVLSGDVDVSAIPCSNRAVWRVKRDLHIANPPAGPIVFCGIARPEGFLEQLRTRGVNPVAQEFYPDHHAYSDADIANLIRIQAQNAADGFITTEKDEVNMGSKITRLDPVWLAGVTMELAEPPDALDTVLRVIRARKPQA